MEKRRSLPKWGHREAWHVEIGAKPPASLLKSTHEKDQKTIGILRSGLNELETKFNVLENDKKIIEEKLKRSTADVKNLKRQLERSQGSGESENEDLQKQLNNLNNQIEQNEMDFQKEIDKWKNISKEDHLKIEKLKDEISELKKGVQKCAAKDGVALLFVDGKYTSKAKLGMAKLKTLGVADEKMGQVIKAVMEMADITPNRLPSASTAARASFFLAALNRMQLFQMLLDAAQRGISTTLGSDETTKNGKKLEAFVLYTIDEVNKAREYCLGMVDILDKSAATAIEKLQHVVQQLESEEGCNLWETFIMTVGNVMSDQAATQKRFNDLLQQIKQVIVENDERYNNMSPADKENLYKLRMFYCQLHILSNATPIVTDALLAHEQRCRENNTIPESSAVKFIKEVGRLCGERAASKYDVHQKWVANAKVKGIKHATIPDYKGHRWMILFAMGGTVQYLKDDLLEFDKNFKTKLREVELKKWFDDPVTSSHLLIIAAVNEFITSPFWRLTEHDSSINSITTHAQSLINFLERVVKDPMLLLTGEPPLDEYEEDFEITERSKAHRQKLDATNPQHPLIIKEAIADVTEALLTYFKKQFKDFLPGGDHYECGKQTNTVPRSNRRVESIFGLATWGFQHAPNQRTVVREAKIQATVNDLFGWFDQKKLEEKENILTEAMAAAPKIEHDAAAQIKAFENETWKRLLLQKEADDKKDRVKSRQEKEAYDKVQKYGGEWQSTEAMNSALIKFNKESQKKKTVIDNLRYHKLCLQTVPANSKLLTITTNGKAKPLDELVENLSALITMAKRDNNEESEEENDDY